MKETIAKNIVAQYSELKNLAKAYSSEFSKFAVTVERLEELSKMKGGLGQMRIIAEFADVNAGRLKELSEQLLQLVVIVEEGRAT